MLSNVHNVFLNTDKYTRFGHPPPHKYIFSVELPFLYSSTAALLFMYGLHYAKQLFCLSVGLSVRALCCVSGLCKFV